MTFEVLFCERRALERLRSARERLDDADRMMFLHPCDANLARLLLAADALDDACAVAEEFLIDTKNGAAGERAPAPRPTRRTT